MGYFSDLNEKRKNATHNATEAISNVGSALESGVRDLGRTIDEGTRSAWATYDREVTQPVVNGFETGILDPVKGYFDALAAPFKPNINVPLPKAGAGGTPTPPSMNDPSVDAAARAALGMMGRGRTSTILTSGSGEDESLLKTSRVVLGR